jgi:spore germination cell wall hydrolase CwlJ-like protein
MFTSLLHEARIWPTVWRRKLAWYGLRDAKDSLSFLAMLGIPVLALVGIVYIAYFQGSRVAPASVQVSQREIERAQRRDLECLAENIYFEARGEPIAGQYAVAEVTLNRTMAPNFPHTICAVVHEMRWDPGRRRYVADFSWTELGDLSPDDGQAWQRAMAVANAVYDDEHEPVVPGALFYHATSVRPGWARARKAIATIGNHIFYR